LSYPDVIKRSDQIIEDMKRTSKINTRLIQVQAFPGASGNFARMASDTGAEFDSFAYPSSLTTTMQGAAEKKPEEVKPQIGYSISIVNNDHYITSELEINATITGFNDVTPRPGAQKLVAMADGKPVLTTWRYGLGRVAALSTDDGNTWASSIYTAQSSKLISATANWAIGDPRPEENRIDSEDGWQGTPLQISIVSDARPAIDGASIEKVGDKRYVATLTPDDIGIYYIGDYGIAVNYPLEYKDIGFNPDLPGLIMANGGKMFTEAEAMQSLESEASRLNQRTVQERDSRRDVLLLTALSIFIAEVIFRRYREIKKRGRSGRRP
jgi:hypothetical protein